MKKLFIAVTAVVLAAAAAPAFAAMNPFMDVPASHWAYDAVAQLAARGVVSGYPDGTFKGQQPATRYEIASIIARTIAYVDMENMGKQDVEMLKRLIVEFSDELNALGMELDEMNERFGIIAKDLGGWKFSGEFDFRMNFGTDTRAFLGDNGVHNFDLDKYRINIDKKINETTTLSARLKNGGGGLAAWDYYYLTTNIGYDVMLDIGNFGINFEDELGLVGDDGAYIGDITLNALRARKDWGMASIKLVVARRDDGRDEWNGNQFGHVDDEGEWVGSWKGFLIGANINLTLNEKFQAGVYAYYWLSDYDHVVGIPDKALDAAAYVKFKFHPSIELKGVYYFQDYDGDDYDDSNQNAWKVILAVDQDLLKFTSLQLEYAQIDGKYNLWRDPYTLYGFGLPNKQKGEKVKIVGVKADQKWGETKKWDTWQRYYMASYDADEWDDIHNIGVGIGYQVNPDVHFGLGYDYVDWKTAGRYGEKANEKSDHLIRFQTTVAF